MNDLASAPKTTPTLKLDSSQAEQAGLVDLTPGDEYNLSVRIRVKGGGNEFEVVSTEEAEPAEPDTTEGENAKPEPASTRPPKSRVLSPRDSGLYNDEETM